MQRMTVIKGRGLCKGVAEGEALVTSQSISFVGGIDVDTGRVVEKGHQLEGQSIVGKVLVFPQGKGSTAGSYAIYAASLRGTGPRAIINLEAEPIITTGAIMGGIPLIDKLERNPLEAIQSGDWVCVDGERGLVELTRPSHEVG